MLNKRSQMYNVNAYPAAAWKQEFLNKATGNTGR